MIGQGPKNWLSNRIGSDRYLLESEAISEAEVPSFGWGFNLGDSSGLLGRQRSYRVRDSVG
jgi:hypothetical protein